MYLAGSSPSLFANYRQQREVDSELGSDNNTVSTLFSVGTQSLALAKLAGDARVLKKVAGHHVCESK